MFAAPCCSGLAAAADDDDDDGCFRFRLPVAVRRVDLLAAGVGVVDVCGGVRAVDRALRRGAAGGGERARARPRWFD